MCDKRYSKEFKIKAVNKDYKEAEGIKVYRRGHFNSLARIFRAWPDYPEAKNG